MKPASKELTAGMVQESAPVLLHKKVARDHYRMRLKSPAAARRAQAGQFLHVRCREAESQYYPLLRRPLSLLDVDAAKGTLDFVYKVMGLGTAVLAEIPAGARVDFIGPLGRPFPLPGKGRQAVLIGGGVGIPPLVFLAKWLKQKGIRSTAYLGARTKDWVICRDDFKKLGVPVRAATDDGSLGYRGSVVELAASSDRDAEFYICGPTGMMAAAAELARRRKTPAHVSLEERMGCAMGCCMGCVVEVNTEPAGSHARFQRVCTEGPVFLAEQIIWK